MKVQLTGDFGISSPIEVGVVPRVWQHTRRHDINMVIPGWGQSSHSWYALIGMATCSSHNIIILDKAAGQDSLANIIIAKLDVWKEMSLLSPSSLHSS